LEIVESIAVTSCSFSARVSAAAEAPGVRGPDARGFDTLDSARIVDKIESAAGHVSAASDADGLTLEDKAIFIFWMKLSISFAGEPFDSISAMVFTTQHGNGAMLKSMTRERRTHNSDKIEHKSEWAVSPAVVSSLTRALTASTVKNARADGSFALDLGATATREDDMMDGWMDGEIISKK
jgi:hypothetical protein